MKLTHIILFELIDSYLILLSHFAHKWGKIMSLNKFLQWNIRKRNITGYWGEKDVCSSFVSQRKHAANDFLKHHLLGIHWHKRTMSGLLFAVFRVSWLGLNEGKVRIVLWVTGVVGSEAAKVGSNGFVLPCDTMCTSRKKNCAMCSVHSNANVYCFTGIDALCLLDNFWVTGRLEDNLGSEKGSLEK